MKAALKLVETSSLRNDVCFAEGMKDLTLKSSFKYKHTSIMISECFVGSQLIDLLHVLREESVGIDRRNW